MVTDKARSLAPHLMILLNLVVGSLGFAILFTAKFFTRPQCFLVFYSDRGHAIPRDWSFEMLAFYLFNTPLGPALIVVLIASIIAVYLLKTVREWSLLELVLVTIPFALLLIPALFWSDIPFSGWSVHILYHDGRGSYPLSFIKPRYLAMLTISILIILGLLKYFTGLRRIEDK